MTKRKKNKIKDAPNLKKFRSEIQTLTRSDRFFPRQGPKQTRKQKRKEARLEKKSRKDAYCRRIAIPSKEEIEKAKNEAIQQQKEEAKLKKMEDMKKKKKARKERQKQQERESHEEQRRVENMWDDKEIKELEKKLGLNKRKKKDTLPLSFKTDGLDYILDVVDTEKLQAMTKMAEEDEEGNEFGLMGDDDDDDAEDVINSDYDEDDDEDDDDDGNDDDGNEVEKDKTDKNLLRSEAKTSDKVESEIKGKEKWEELADRIKIIAEKKAKSKKNVRFADSDEHKENDEDSDAGSEENDYIDENDDEILDDIESNDDEENYLDDDDDDDEINEDLNDTDNLESENVGNSDDDDEIDDDDENSDENDDEDSADDDNEFGTNINSNQTEKRKSKDDIDELKEDIYGRLRDSQGNIIRDNKPAGGDGAYVPPAKRLQMAGSADEKKKFMLERLQKQLKGLVNSAILNFNERGKWKKCPISRDRTLYLATRADVNETLVDLISDACITPTLTPDRLSMELMMLVAILHGNVGSEVGAVFLQHFAKRFNLLLMEAEYGSGKLIDNIVVLVAHLYNFKVVYSVLIFDILKKLTESFQERDIEIILLLLRHVGFSLRKDSPIELKEFIISVQTRAGSPDAAKLNDQSRVRFMLEVIMAIRNNNMRKIPNYDPEHLDHLRKLSKLLSYCGQFGDNQLHISLEDLLNAEEKGKWWLVGSAWDGKQVQHHNQGSDKMSTVVGKLEVSSKLQELARKQRMNTDIRRNIFFVIMTSEDYLDAFEKLIQLGLKSSQRQEIILVIMDCCLQEKKYNPFYSYLAQKFCDYHRTYQMAFQFCIWDKFKEIGSLSEHNRNNLSKLLIHLIVNKAQSLSILKVVSFGTLEKGMVRLLKQLLTDLLLEQSQSEVEAAFTRIAQIDKLKPLNEGLRLFLRHFLVGKKSETKSAKLIERVDIVDHLLSRGKSQVLL
ncbi:nucleolar MIF4G domain-containing protein 1-like [Ruditapes philippinarum]|uniref:nucleolar MIF4G domain-containing protein 1-like n=1 Tax=Ruditapes philippinarum TaxID=129788 RepID=UPI00295B3FC8|nr:nucleolar MIF4G domain-containing protein 1-like [Ruditapes philippinarum]